MKLDYRVWGATSDIGHFLRNDAFVVFGASPAAGEVVRYLEANGKNIVAYADNSVEKQKAGFNGRGVWNAKDAANFARDRGAIVIASVYQIEIARQLIDEFGAPRERIFPYVSSMFAGHFGAAAIEENWPRIQHVHHRLADVESQNYFRDLLKFRWTMSPLDLPRNRRVTGFYGYDATGMGPHKGARIVDCGAYTGDTAEAYLKRLDGDATITAIEPMPENFRRLVETVRANGWTARVAPINAAVGETDGMIEVAGELTTPDPRATALGAPSLSRTKVPMMALDSLFRERMNDVDLIKIDIEGYEADALNGAARLIEKSKPDLAIAGYHRAADMWELPERILAIDPGYEIFAGHHPTAAYEIEFYCTHKSRRKAA